MKFTAAAVFATFATAAVAHKHHHKKLRAADFPNLETIMSQNPEGGLDSTRGKRSLAEVNVADMDGLFNTVSNNDYGDNTGNSIMANGDTTILADGLYKCSEGTCADRNPFPSLNMLYTDDLNGEVKCVEDNASCVLDGENTRRGMSVEGTGSGTLILRALTFDNCGNQPFGGGVNIYGGAIVDLKLLVFSYNLATEDSWGEGGGGAIYVEGSGSSVNAYGTSFIENRANTGNGVDIYINGGTITIHSSCPSPYTSNLPIQGSALDIEGTVGGDKYSYSDCYFTLAPTSAPTDSPTSAPTDSPTSAPTDSPTSAPTTAPTMLPTLSPTVAPASGSGLGTAETGGLVGGVLVFFAVCFCVYKMCFKTTENIKNDASKGDSGYELASAQ
ncbi:hypothetical protein TrVE_jg8688 [Triparma verrucosa]|uniref:Uncharacterized protein n=1 Tax=Triparma verrucosa TaxID=1606542 RepID=A0A9W7AZQ1_9STRA|nr:hypothetical protein TrVE_jg8688 [Triparma verrucosa]